MYKLIFAILIIFTLASCKKEENITGNIQGNIQLNILLKHHTWGVSNLNVYLIRNATVWPGTDTSQYEYSKTSDIDGHVSFNNLSPGSYYVYATGYDVIWGDTVIGYTGVALNKTTLENLIKNLTMYVSE